MGRANPALAVALDQLHYALSDPAVDVVASLRTAQRGGMVLTFELHPASARSIKRSTRSYDRLQRRWEPRLNADAAPFVPDGLPGEVADAPAARALTGAAERAEAEPPEAAERPAEPCTPGTRAKPQARGPLSELAPAAVFVSLPEAGRRGATAAATTFQAVWRGYAVRHRAGIVARAFRRAKGIGPAAMRAYRAYFAQLGHDEAETEAALRATVARAVAERRVADEEAEREACWRQAAREARGDEAMNERQKDAHFRETVVLHKAWPGWLAWHRGSVEPRV